MRDTCSVSGQAHTQECHTHYTPSRSSPPPLSPPRVVVFVLAPPCLDVVRVLRGLGVSHSLYITRATRTLVVCVLLVLRVLPCLACVTLMRADRGGALQKCRIGGPPKRGGCFEEIQPLWSIPVAFSGGVVLPSIFPWMPPRRDS